MNAVPRPVRLPGDALSLALQHDLALPGRHAGQDGQHQLRRRVAGFQAFSAHAQDHKDAASRRRRGQRSTGCVGAPACELGYQVLEAEDGLRALHTQDGLPRLDLLVTDVGLLNGMNGRQLAEAVRQLRPGLPVMFITG
jgi:hypothetical protein